MCEFCGCSGRRTIKVSNARRIAPEASDELREAAFDGYHKVRSSRTRSAEGRLDRQAIAAQAEAEVANR